MYSFISTPKSPADGKELYGTRVDKIVDLLTGQGKPWAGITPTRRGYLKPTSERELDQFALRANSKVLIEYSNNQEAAFGQEQNPTSKQFIASGWSSRSLSISGTPKWTFKKMPLVRNLIRNVNCHGKHRAKDRVCTAKPGSYLRPENSVLMGQHFSSHLVRVPLSDAIFHSIFNPNLNVGPPTPSITTLPSAVNE